MKLFLAIIVSLGLGVVDEVVAIAAEEIGFLLSMLKSIKERVDRVGFWRLWAGWLIWCWDGVELLKEKGMGCWVY